MIHDLSFDIHDLFIISSLFSLDLYQQKVDRYYKEWCLAPWIQRLTNMDEERIKYYKI